MGTCKAPTITLGLVGYLTCFKPRDDIYGPYKPAYLQTSGPKTHTQSPAVTGTSVIAVKFNGGVAIAADNLGMFDILLRRPAFGSLIFNAVIFALTILKTWKAYRIANAAGLKASFHGYLLRDG